MTQRTVIGVMALGLALSACFKSERRSKSAFEDPSSEGAAASGGSGGLGSGGGGAAGTSNAGASGTPSDDSCARQSEIEIASGRIDKVDLLFVVDNSGSMREEQAALRREFPRLIRTLTTGDRDSDGVRDFAPASDLHLGVVSSDMGLANVDGIPGCEGLGDDGVMNNVPDPELSGCQANYPRFLSYVEGVDDPAQAAADFGCLASLGTDGCGFEQQLEAALKALWPSVERDWETDRAFPMNRIQFLDDDNGFGAPGHGDRENAGFLRNDPAEGLSLISIVVVTDEEDCSSQNTRHFTPDTHLQPDDPLYSQDLNLRCFNNPQNLYSLDRYLYGFRALRPGREQLVTFTAIAGVPADLVNHGAEVDFDDEAARRAYYDHVLNDSRMIERVDPDRTPEMGRQLIPSCETATGGPAYPPRRLVELARRFGGNGALASICDDDFGPAVESIIDIMARQLDPPCLARPLSRGSDGLTGCELVWHLPAPNLAPTGTPTACSGHDLLSEPASGPSTHERGGAICSVRQLPVVDNELTGGGQGGWYYDDFSDGVESGCRPEARQRIAFTAEATPPPGVSVRLRCGQADPCR